MDENFLQFVVTTITRIRHCYTVRYRVHVLMWLILVCMYGLMYSLHSKACAVNHESTKREC